MTKTVNIAQKLSLFDEHWSPRIVGKVNDMHVKVVKLQGEFVWHHHDEEDELFLVTEGVMEMHYRDDVQVVREGEFIIVPHGVEHKPVVPEGECHIMLFEPANTVNTGSAEDSDLTYDAQWI